MNAHLLRHEIDQSNSRSYSEENHTVIFCLRSNKFEKFIDVIAFIKKTIRSTEMLNNMQTHEQNGQEKVRPPRHPAPTNMSGKGM